MASVFLSYDREDAAKARPIALALEKAGHSVWWDLHVRGGAQFSKVIEEALKAADAVVVLWSERSVDSAWVRDEAAAGRDTGRLVPVSLDETEPPLGFRQFQTIDLARWKGRGRIPRIADLLAAIDALGHRNKAAVSPAPIVRGAASERPRHLLAISLAVLALVLVAVALLIWRPWPTRSTTPIVAVVAADPKPQSNALARDLLVQLGRLEATNPNALRLVATASEDPDLVLEASAGAQANEATAGLVLLEGKDRALLWSKDYTEPTNRQADLRQQVAYSAAQVLRCAAEAMAKEGKPLKQEVRKLYLNGCAQMAGGGESDPTAVVDLFERVTIAAPQFRPAWERLLLASANAALTFQAFPGPGPGPKEVLRRHIAEASERFSDLPEILLAKAVIAPPDAYQQRLALLDRAKQVAPTDPVVLEYRAGELMHVGRLIEALSDAQRALQLDPLSPTATNAFITTLTYAGRFSAAEEALKQAERFWPGSSSVRDAKFRFHLRYGDPRAALEMLREHGTSPEHEAFLEARIDPTPEAVEHAVSLMRVAAIRTEDYSWLAQTLAEFGRNEELYSTLIGWKGPLAGDGFEVLFRPQFKKFRSDPRFLQLANRAGLLEHWRESGKWPDFCFEPDLPYDCKKEAAKLLA